MKGFRHVFRFVMIAGIVFFGSGQIAVSSGQERGLDGQTLVTFCTGKFDTDFGVCSGYVMAVAEMMMRGNPAYGRHACGHDGIKAQQLVDLVRMEVSENRDLVRQQAGPLVAHVLAQSFPCDGVTHGLEPASGE